MPRTMVDRFEQRKATRAKLIDAALGLFATSGYEHATVDDISQAAGYSKGAYYFHFSTKDDILLELLRMWSEGRSALLAAELEGQQPSPEELRDAIARFVSYRDEARWPAVLLEFWSQAVRNKDISGKLAEVYAGWRRQLAGAFATAGTLTQSAAEDAAGVALAAHDGYAVQVAIDAPGVRALTPAGIAEALVASLLTQDADERRAAAI